jgi:hypothetical protein
MFRDMEYNQRSKGPIQKTVAAPPRPQDRVAVFPFSLYIAIEHTNEQDDLKTLI